MGAVAEETRRGAVGNIGAMHQEILIAVKAESARVVHVSWADVITEPKATGSVHLAFLVSPA